MALELVTGYWGQEHVTAEQDADLNAGVVGSGLHVLPIGEKMRAEAVTSNKIRIFDGLFMGYGRQCMIEEGAYEDVEIENGTAGLLRNDMIIVRYKKDEVTGIEGVSFSVLKGQTGATAVDPTPNNQNIRTGAFESEMPLYRVKLNGLAIEAIEPLYTIPRTNTDLSNSIDSLKRNLEIKQITLSSDNPAYFEGNCLAFNLSGGAYLIKAHIIIKSSIVSGLNAITFKGFPFRWKYITDIPGGILNNGTAIVMQGGQGEDGLKLGTTHGALPAGTTIDLVAVFPPQFLLNSYL
ncbi:MAG: hypothetical protein QM793_06805 [Muricomes sp.]